MYTKPPYSMAKIYGTVLSVSYITSFYAPLIPVSLIYSILGLTLYYWVDKFRLYRHRSINYKTDSKIIREMMEFLELVLPLYCFSNFLFDYFLNKH